MTADPVTDDATEPLAPVVDPPATTDDGSAPVTGGDTALAQDILYRNGGHTATRMRAAV